jgi:hypothetical protein
VTDRGTLTDPPADEHTASTVPQVECRNRRSRWHYRHVQNLLSSSAAPIAFPLELTEGTINGDEIRVYKCRHRSLLAVIFTHIIMNETSLSSCWANERRSLHPGGKDGDVEGSR